jgi:enoyl-CoA hydratase/carnithine racemase
VPVIAAVHGPAIGGGLQIALAADIRIVAPSASLAAKEIDFGITLDMGGTQILPRLVGYDVALELILTGRALDGAEAVKVGLATRMADDPLAEARELARMIATRSPEAVRGSKRLVRLSDEVPAEEGMDAELEFMAWNIGRANQSESSRARLQGSTPVYSDPPPEMPLPPFRP